MNDTKDLSYFLSSAGLLAIGIFSIGYVWWKSLFAELHIQFGFLDFPIFVGELLLGLCLILVLVKWRIDPQPFKIWYVIPLIYGAFVVIKALGGYVEWGPLALRDSALFYYPLFIMLGYCFYRADFFDPVRKFLIWLVIVILFIVNTFDNYWLYTCFILALLMTCAISLPRLKWSMLVLLFIVTPYIWFFLTSRMMFVGNMVSLSFVFLCFYAIIPMRRWTKVMLGVCLGLLIVGGIFKMADNTQVRSIWNYNGVVGLLQQRDEEMEQKRQDPVVQDRLALERKAQLFVSDDLMIRQKVAKKKRQVSLSEKAAIQKVDESLKVFSPEKVVVQKVEEESKVSMVKTNWEKIKESVLVFFFDNPIFQNMQLERLDRLETLWENRWKVSIPADSVNKHEKIKFEAELYNSAFRLYVWRDMWRQWYKERPIFGFEFGKPLRSESLEILNWAMGEWTRDGWIAAHNSYFYMLYRAGIIGLLVILTLVGGLVWMIIHFFQLRSITGLMLCSILINWFVAANFLVIFELPYTAIPIWSLYGMTLAYGQSLKQKSKTMETVAAVREKERELIA